MFLFYFFTSISCFFSLRKNNPSYTKHENHQKNIDVRVKQIVLYAYVNIRKQNTDVCVKV